MKFRNLKAMEPKRQVLVLTFWEWVGCDKLNFLTFSPQILV